MKFAFKETKTPQELQDIFLGLRRKEKTQHHIPIICEGNAIGPRPAKFLVLPDTTIGEFSFHVRKCLCIRKYEAIFFLFGGGAAVPPSKTVAETYEEYKDETGFLFVAVVRESVFGK